MRIVLFLAILMAPFIVPTLSSAQIPTPSAPQYIAAGNKYYSIKDYSKALLYYQAATQVDPGSALAFQGLGNANYMLGQKTTALIAYEKAMALDPTNVQLSRFVQTLNAQNNESSTVVTITPTPSVPKFSKFELDLTGGIDEPVSPDGYSLSVGGGGAFYFSLNRATAIGISLSLYSFSYQGPTSTSTVTENGITTTSQSGGGSATEFEGLVILKLRLSTGNFNPYILVGAGLSDYNDTVDGSVLNPAISGGLGYELSLGSGANLFLEGKTNAIIASNTTIIHIPINAGINFGL
jgi:tetratricopeptide (TPR) repeat protein